jgi:hypothetical protein
LEALSPQPSQHYPPCAITQNNPSLIVPTFRLAFYDLRQRVTQAIQIHVGASAQLQAERDNVVQFQSSLLQASLEQFLLSQ